ncbi:hypothetical protein QQF64_009719, partial [Cirrhinus molitorella]
GDNALEYCWFYKSPINRIPCSAFRLLFHLLLECGSVKNVKHSRSTLSS